MVSQTFDFIDRQTGRFRYEGRSGAFAQHGLGNGETLFGATFQTNGFDTAKSLFTQLVESPFMVVFCENFFYF